MKLGVVTLVNYDLLDALLESAERARVKPTGYVIIDNGGAYRWQRAAAIIGRRPTVTLEIEASGANVGVAAAWNRILDIAGDEPIVIANDDVVLGENTFAELCAALDRAPFVSGDGWALFGQRPDCTRRIGPYDENFWPAYYEDVDYRIRLNLADIEPVQPLSAPLEHLGWSTTLALGNSPWMAKGRERSRRYLIAKWGADTANAATYREPFNGRPPPGWTERPRTGGG